MCNVHRECMPNPLVAIIAAQKVQNIQCRVTEMKMNLGHSIPAVEKECDLLLPMLGGLTANDST